MIRADSGKVQWDSGKKKWLVIIQVGAEVIKRPLSKHEEKDADDALRSLAVQTARDEGYDLEAAGISIVR